MSILHKTLGCLYVDSYGVVQFGFNGLNPQIVTGTELLMQNIVIRLFTSQASNAFEGDIGGSLYDLLGKGYVVGEEDSLREDFANAFAFVEFQMKEEQDSQTDLIGSERLSSIVVESVEYKESTQSWEISVRVTSSGGVSSSFTLNT